MAEQPGQEESRAWHPFQTRPWVASGAETRGEAWGFTTQSTVPLPVGLTQLILAWLAARNVRPPVGLLAAVVLSVVCLISVLAGLFDG